MAIKDLTKGGPTDVNLFNLVSSLPIIHFLYFFYLIKMEGVG